MKKSKELRFVAKVTVFSTLFFVLWSLLSQNGPIPQNLSYHNFADSRLILGIQNFMDVASNLPFLIIGIIGMQFAWRARLNKTFIQSWERAPYILFFLGSALVALGSAYYHFNPQNHTLVWDRLPMTISFMSIFSIICYERAYHKIWLWITFILIAIGVSTVFYWNYTESIGHGDLRFYLMVQFFPMVCAPFVVVFIKSKYTKTSYLIASLGCYALAKFLEIYDKEIFGLTKQFISGHTLKHLSAAISIYLIYLMLVKRHIKTHKHGQYTIEQPRSAGI